MPLRKHKVVAFLRKLLKCTEQNTAGAFKSRQQSAWVMIAKEDKTTTQNIGLAIGLVTTETIASPVL